VGKTEDEIMSTQRQVSMQRLGEHFTRRENMLPTVGSTAVYLGHVSVVPPEVSGQEEHADWGADVDVFEAAERAFRSKASEFVRAARAWKMQAP
jgi:hypothetical protein